MEGKSKSSRCNSCGSKLDKFGRALPQVQSDGYRSPSLTVDIGVIRKNEKFQILLINRGHPPFKGKLAFPGGFVDYNEDPKDAALRELKEETNLIGMNPTLIGAYGSPQRDPRKHIVSLFYFVDVSPKDLEKLQAGDDAADAKFYDIDSIKPEELAFDHSLLFKDLLAFLTKEKKITSL